MFFFVNFVGADNISYHIFYNIYSSFLIELRMGNLMKLIVPIMIGLFYFVSCADDATENEERYFTVTFNSMGGSEVKEQKVKAGEHAVKPENPTKDGVVFLGWFKSENFESEWVFDVDVVDSDITLYAKWLAEIETCMISFDTNGGDDIEPVSVEKGNTITGLPTPVKDGFVFDGWFTDESFTNPFDESILIASDMTLYAKWKPEVDDTVKKQLEDLINKANGLNEEDYSETSYRNLQKALEAAKNVAANSGATTEEIQTAYDNLKKAIDGLIPGNVIGKPYKIFLDDCEYCITEGLWDGKYIMINGSSTDMVGVSFDLVDATMESVENDEIEISYDGIINEWTNDGVRTGNGRIDFTLKGNLAAGQEAKVIARSKENPEVSLEVIFKICDESWMISEYTNLANQLPADLSILTIDNYLDYMEKYELAFSLDLDGGINASTKAAEAYAKVMAFEREVGETWWYSPIVNCGEGLYAFENHLFKYTPASGGVFPQGEMFSNAVQHEEDEYHEFKVVIGAKDFVFYYRETINGAIGTWEIDIEGEYKYVQGENGNGAFIIHMTDDHEGRFLSRSAKLKRR